MSRVLLAIFLVALVVTEYVRATEFGDKAKNAAEKTEDKFNEGKQAASDAKDTLGERIKSGYEEGKAMASGAKDQLGKRVEETGKSIQD